MNMPVSLQETSDYFEQNVYPFFRYINGVTDQKGFAMNQVPDGSYVNTGHDDTTPMEEL
jgi:hypothetical protein